MSKQSDHPESLWNCLRRAVRDQRRFSLEEIWTLAAEAILDGKLPTHFDGRGLALPLPPRIGGDDGDPVNGIALGMHIPQEWLDAIESDLWLLWRHIRIPNIERFAHRYDFVFVDPRALGQLMRARSEGRRGGRPSVHEAVWETLSRMQRDGFNLKKAQKRLAEEVARRNGRKLGDPGWHERTIVSHVSMWQRHQQG